MCLLFTCSLTWEYPARYWKHDHMLPLMSTSACRIASKTTMDIRWRPLSLHPYPQIGTFLLQITQFAMLTWFNYNYRQFFRRDVQGFPFHICAVQLFFFSMRLGLGTSIQSNFRPPPSHPSTYSTEGKNPSVECAWACFDATRSRQSKQAHNAHCFNAMRKRKSSHRVGLRETTGERA